MVNSFSAINRRGSDSVKWNVGEGELPMWVADMDFPACDPIQEALRARLEHGVFGYTRVGDDYRDAVANWWAKRHGFTVDSASVTFTTGVVPALSCAVRAWTNVAENVLITPPVYHVFYSVISGAGRAVREAPLAYRDGQYSFDWPAIEEAMAEEETAMFVLCNPHNPTGNVWASSDLACIGALAERYHVAVFSDEIHCDITAPGIAHTPFAAASQQCAALSATACSPSKAFNIAGLQSAYVFSDNERLLHRLHREMERSDVSEPNAFALTSTIAAYRHGEEWLDEVCELVHANKLYVAAALEESGLPARAIASDSTYLLWIDCTALSHDSKALHAFLREETGLFLSPGVDYGQAGEGFLRMNLATSPELVADGTARLIAGLRALSEKAVS